MIWNHNYKDLRNKKGDTNNKMREEAKLSTEKYWRRRTNEEYSDNIVEHRSFKPSSLIDNDDDYYSSGYNLYFPSESWKYREISLAILLMRV